MYIPAYNYAQSQPTQQSSIADPEMGISSLAVDGLDFTNYQDASCTMTCGKMEVNFRNLHYFWST